MLHLARLVSMIGLLTCMVSTVAVAEPAAANPEAVEFFEKKIRPVLVKHCYECHSAKSKSVKGELLLDTRAGVRRGGDSGASVVPGKLDDSLLLDAIRYDGLEMPPKGKLSASVIADFERWIKSGAVDPREGDAAPKKSSIDLKKGLEFWAFQPPVMPKTPQVRQTDWPKTDVDRFVLKKLEQAKMKPSAAADRRTLIRRATFGLIGLPPTPEEVEAFLADTSPKAFEKVIDRLLASPNYGERWGRHWLDVARYAEDQAHTFKARRYPQGFRYRDWVVNSLNSDMPYDQFVQTQIAGDLLPGPNRHDRVAALGLFALGPVYYQDNGEKAKALADEWDDRLDTLARGVLGLTVACARCHDHKFDPISMEDYYGLAGIFAASNYQERPVVSAEIVAKKQQADAKAKEQQLAIDRFLAGESRKLRPALADSIPQYILVAWKVHNERKAKPKDKKQTERIAKQEKLSKFLLDRWVKYLFAKPKPKKRPWLNDWYALIASQDAKMDLSKDEKSIADVRQAANQIHEQIQSLLPKRQDLFAQFGEDVAFVKAVDRAPVVSGVTPLGNLFDDSAGTSLASAAASDQFKAAASNNSLGVDRVTFGWGTTTEIAPGIRFDCTQIGSDSAKYGEITNDGWNNIGGIRTTGKSVAANSGRMEQGIGMHANALITFDLDEIRKAGLLPVDQKFTFRVDRAGLNDDVAGSGTPSVHLAAIVSAPHKKTDVYDAIIAGYINGQRAKVSENDRVYYFSGEIPKPLKADGQFAAFDVPIPANAKYLTLISAGAAKDGDENTINSDHAVFSGARLEQNPLPKPATKPAASIAAKTINEDDRPNAILLSELLHDKGLLAIPAAEAATHLIGEPQNTLASLKQELDIRKKAATAIAVPIAHSLTEGQGRDIKVYKQGDPTKQGELAPRSLLAILTGGKRIPFDTKGSGRLELAQAVASRDNPLTARVMVNRVWQRHFGFGLVRTPSNFGELGERPTHPQLLDYLALKFIESGWSLKALHKQIMLTATYQQSSDYNKANFQSDAENRLLWRMNRQRLEVEPWRDAMLAVSGQLDRTLGGPSSNLASANNRRRTLYGFISRHKLDELLRLFDFPDPNITSDIRSVTTVPLQQLFVLNSEFTIARAKALAARLMGESSADDSDRIGRAYQLLYGRKPSEREFEVGLKFLAATSEEKQEGDDLSPWEQYALALLGANEFTYID